jgi:hypothetical protein
MFKTIEIDGQRICWHLEDCPRPWIVEVGKGPRGAYKVRYSFDNPQQAVFYYRCVNIGNGYKKRLRCLTAGGKPIARAFS